MLWERDAVRARVQQTLFSPVYEAPHRAISTGVLRPGQRVNQAEVARQMRVSMAPLKLRRP